jgi:FkbM family methyltransferase
MHLATKLRPLAARVVRSLPSVRGRGSLARATNAIFLKAGAEPIAVAQMKQGHLMMVDCRLFSHAHAFFSGEYDDQKITVLTAFLSTEGTALDVGANIGFYSVPLALAARRVGARVISVEPFRGNADWLRRNLALNQVDRFVTVLDIGLSSQSKEEQLMLREDFGGGASVGNASIADHAADDPKFERVSVRVEPLDAVWPRLKRTKLDAVKVDIEGHEDRFLEGASKTLREHRPAILTEVNRWFYERRGVDFDERITQLLPPGYEPFEVVDGRANPLGSIAQARDSDVLLVPAEKVAILRRFAMAGDDVSRRRGAHRLPPPK